MRQMIIAGAAILVGGLQSGQADAQDGAPRIDDIVWVYIDSYCSFMRADHSFDYNDPDSWRWVLFSNLPGEDGADPLDTPFMRLDGQLKQLAQTGAQKIDGGLARTYTSHDAVPYVVEMKTLKGAQGYESTAFSGTIKVSRNGASSEIAYKGDCGV
ncbi:hypothetical protein WNZ14_02740 [Hoeflea sp. AS60]|uniref:hypothetical protein n=1 Tax=Hoeflea sp. AS60 TaxID=3135780 RepID=UPI003172C3BE